MFSMLDNIILTSKIVGGAGSAIKYGKSLYDRLKKKNEEKNKETEIESEEVVTEE